MRPGRQARGAAERRGTTGDDSPSRGKERRQWCSPRAEIWRGAASETADDGEATRATAAAVVCEVDRAASAPAGDAATVLNRREGTGGDTTEKPRTLAMVSAERERKPES